MHLIERLWHRYVLRHKQSQKEVTARVIFMDGALQSVIRCECGRVWEA